MWTDPGWFIYQLEVPNVILILGCMTSNLLVLELPHFVFYFFMENRYHSLF